MNNLRCELSESSIRLLEKEIPGVDKKDITNLISNIEAISKGLRASFNQDLKVADKVSLWVPENKTTKEALGMNLGIDQLNTAIQDFRIFSKTKGWGIQDNLDAKFITHIKIMLQQKKLVIF